MLIKCPECELQVSDKAVACPHCGYPLKNQTIKYVRSPKRRRLPNGFGQISEIKGRKLRKPFRAMITVGKDQWGKPIAKPLKPESYFATYNEAYAALVEYNKDPYDLNRTITLKEIYGQWSKEKYARSSAATVRVTEMAWKLCSLMYDMDIREIKIVHIKACMDRTTSGQGKKRIKTLVAQLLDLAMENEYIDKNVARNFKLSDTIKDLCEVKSSHKCFTEDEMEIYWNNEGDLVADMILIQCYSGWRPNELLKLKNEDVDLENMIFIGGLKTKAGIGRIVPIHEKIRGIVKRYYNEDSEYLFGHNYEWYRSHFLEFNEEHQISEHRLHDCRKHFVTMAKKYGVDEYAIKRIVGHAIKDITEDVYTERPVEWLKSEMQKIE